MGLKEGSQIIINLQCGHGEKRVTLLHGHQKIECPECGRVTDIYIKINDNDEVSSFEVN